MPPKKKSTKILEDLPKQEDHYIILKNINPIKLIYEHILENGLNNTKEPPIEVGEITDDYVDHIIQDVEVANTTTDILKHQSSMAYTLFTDIRKNNIKSWPILIADDDEPLKGECVSNETNLFNKKTFDYNKTTKVKCWWCKNSFDTLPLGCPIRKDKNQIFMEGIMCSFPCAKSYIKNSGADCGGVRYKDSMTILNYLYDIFKKITDFPESFRDYKKINGNKNIDENEITGKRSFTENNSETPSKEESSKEESTKTEISNNNNNHVIDETCIPIDESTLNVLREINNRSHSIITLTKALLLKLLMIQDDNLENYSDQIYDELYKKINGYSENAEYVLKSYETFYDSDKKTINISEVTFLAQIWTGDMYNSDSIDALKELLGELNNDFFSLKKVQL